MFFRFLLYFNLTRTAALRSGDYDVVITCPGLCYDCSGSTIRIPLDREFGTASPATRATPSVPIGIMGRNAAPPSNSNSLTEVPLVAPRLAFGCVVLVQNPPSDNVVTVTAGCLPCVVLLALDLSRLAHTLLRLGIL